MTRNLWIRMGLTTLAGGLLALLAGCECNDPIAGSPVPYDAPVATAADPYCGPCETPVATGYATGPVYGDGVAYTADPYATDQYATVAYTETMAYSQPVAYAEPIYAGGYAAEPVYDTPPPAKGNKTRGEMSGAELVAIVLGQPPNHVLYLGSVGPYHEVRYSGKGDYRVPVAELPLRRQFATGAATPYLITPYEIGDTGFGGGSPYTSPAPTYTSPAPIYAAPVSSPTYYESVPSPVPVSSDPYNLPYSSAPVLSQTTTVTTVELASTPSTGTAYGLIPTSDEVWY